MVDGDNILYHYLQKYISAGDENDPFYKKLIEKLIMDLSIWFPVNLYKQIPVLLPYVVRDSSCRVKQSNGKHEWGFSNSQGFLRDDNSLIKGIVKPFEVFSSKIKQYNNKRLANGFVASHIWRELKDNDLLSANFHMTNSFVPNLVWLPKQISKLTDREGSYAQRILQSMSYKIYFKSSDDLFHKKIWEFLHNPDVNMISDFDVNDLNYFVIKPEVINKKINFLTRELETILKSLESGIVSDKKIKCSNYIPTLLRDINNFDKINFIKWLEENVYFLKRNL